MSIATWVRRCHGGGRAGGMSGCENERRKASVCPDVLIMSLSVSKSNYVLF
jgi:hypothetical protein